MPTALKKMLFVFKPQRGNMLVAKKKTTSPFFLAVTEAEVACQKEFLWKCIIFKGIVS
jgi:hypothetical protein